MKNVLVVSSRKTINHLLGHAIETKLGHRVFLASTIEQARYYLSEIELFVAVSSMVLPGEEDGSAVDLIMDYDVPCIVLTSSIDNELRKEMIQRGVIDYVLTDTVCADNIVSAIEFYGASVGAKVLVVDDSSSMRALYKDYLSPYGFEILEARTGEEALALVRGESDLSLVLTGYEMPDMDGFELVSSIRRHAGVNELPVIGVSSHDDDLLSAKFIKYGANDFLSRPFQREELYCRLTRAMDTMYYIRTIREMNARVASDLKAASALQQSLLPTSFPDAPGVRMAAVYAPCDELSGDTYNAFALDDDHVGLIQVDVSGHGIQAALLSVTLSHLITPDMNRFTILKEALDEPPWYHIVPPGDVCAKLNQRFQMDELVQYFTMVYGVLDVRNGAFEYCVAGHPRPMLLGAEGDPQELEAGNPPIGFVPGLEYHSGKLRLKPGDRVYFYTDGIVEMTGEQGEEFGTERLGMLLEEVYPDDLQTGLDKILQHARAWGRGRRDDITVCALEYAP